MRRSTSAALMLVLFVGISCAAAVKSGTIKVIGLTGRGAHASSAAIRISGRGGGKTISGTRTVPVGTYRVMGGQVTVKDSKQNIWTAFITFENPKNIRVEAGKTLPVTIGGPMIVEIAPESSSLAISRRSTKHIGINYAIKSGGTAIISGPVQREASVSVTNSAGKVVQRGTAGFS